MCRYFLKGTEYEDLYSKYFIEFLSRKGKSIESDRAIRLTEREEQPFREIASEFIDGEIVGVDQLLPDAINISINVTEQVAFEVTMNRVRFNVKAEIDI